MYKCPCCLTGRANSNFIGFVCKTCLISNSTNGNSEHNRAGHTDFGKGGDLSPPIGGGPKGGDKGPMGGDWRVIRDKIKGTKKLV